MAGAMAAMAGTMSAGRLARAVQGGRRPSQTITWRREGGGVEPLIGAEISGFIRSHGTGETRPIDGDLVLVDGAAGVFRWDYGEMDVGEAGDFDVQFVAEFPEGPTPGKSFRAIWAVESALGDG